MRLVIPLVLVLVASSCAHQETGGAAPQHQETPGRLRSNEIVADAYANMAGHTSDSALIKYLESKEWRAVEAGARTLGLRQLKYAVPGLIRCLQTHGSDESLILSGPPSSKKLGGPEWNRWREANGWVEARCASAVALGRIGDRSALAPLLAASMEKLPRVREASVTALGEMVDPVAFSTVLRRLKDKEDRVRMAAASVLWKWKDPRAIPGLKEAMSDPHLGTRQAAVWALNKLGVKAQLNAEDAAKMRPYGYLFKKPRG